MTLAFAKRCADRLVERFAPLCKTIEIAGSIRRQRPAPSDIDLVVIPRVEVSRDLFGGVTGKANLLTRYIDQTAPAEGWTLLCKGEEILRFEGRGVQVDIFFANPENFGTVLLCKTGSKEHNIWLAQRALDAGGKWVPNCGLYLHSKRYGVTEEEIYGALWLPLLDPRTQRERRT